MKEKIIKFINQIYFGIYLCTGEALPPTIYKGRKTYLHSFWGNKLCFIMILFYVSNIVSLAVYCLGNNIAHLVYRNFEYRLIYSFLVIGISLLIGRITSLEGEKGLSYFETFIAWPRSTKIKWEIYSVLAFIVGAIFCTLGIVLPVIK